MSWDEIKSTVEQHGGVWTTDMAKLRNAGGWDRLGSTVRSNISKALAGMGLGHIPQELPNYQNEPVRIYKRGTAIGDLVETVLSPSESNDTKLRERFGEEPVDYIDIIKKIRDLVAE